VSAPYLYPMPSIVKMQWLWTSWFNTSTNPFKMCAQSKYTST